MRHPTKLRKRNLWRKACGSKCASWSNRWASHVPVSRVTKEKRLARALIAVHGFGGKP